MVRTQFEGQGILTMVQDATAVASDDAARSMSSTIDALHARATASAAEFGLKRVFPAKHQHGSYAFYLQDADTNCWELEIWENGIDPARQQGIESRE